MWPLAGRRVEKKKKEEETLQHDGIEMQFPRLLLFIYGSELALLALGGENVPQVV